MTHGFEGFEEDAQVHLKACVVDVVKFHVLPLARLEVGVVSGFHLPPASDARANGEEFADVAVIGRKFVFRYWARAHNTHAAS